jgi:hypothetical protein
LREGHQSSRGNFQQNATGRNGYDEVGRVRRMLRDIPWWLQIRGEFSGDIMRMSDAELRRFGRAIR